MNLTPDQWAGARFLAPRRVAMIADRAGYGKTAQIARACDLVHAERVTAICPPVLRPNEVAQFEKWSLFGYPAHVIRTGKDRVPADGLVVCSYDLARNPRIRRKLIERGCDVLYLDEAHRLKTPRSKTTIAVLGAGGIAKTAKRIWFCTGSPAPMHNGEYYVFLKIAGAWHGTHDEFVRRYCIVVDGQFGPKIVGNREDTAAELRALLAPHVIARDGVDPGRGPLTLDDVAVEGAPPDLSSVDPDTLFRIERAAAAGDWRALDDPHVSTVRRLVGVAKAQGVAELAATDLEGGTHKMLIFAQHTKAIEIIAARLEKFGAVIFDGRTPAGLRENIIASMQPGADGPRVVVIQWQALREGRDLIGATRVLIAEPAWNPDDNEQMIARAWRRGQRSHVHASFCFLDGSSIDVALSRKLARRTQERLHLAIKPIAA